MLIGGISAIAVDSVKGDLFWSDLDKRTISRALIDGSGEEVIITGGKLSFVYNIQH